jgi:hypothetical protein
MSSADLTVPEVLRRAELRIGVRGWRQGPRPIHCTDTRLCLIEALALASPKGVTEVTWRARTVLKVHLDTWSLVFWNDQEQRTEAEVRAALLAAAERAEAPDAR